MGFLSPKKTLSKQPTVQMLGIWTVIICLIGTFSSVLSLDSLHDENVFSETASESDEAEIASFLPPGIDTGGNLLDARVTGKLLQKVCFDHFGYEISRYLVYTRVMKKKEEEKISFLSLIVFACCFS